MPFQRNYRHQSLSPLLTIRLQPYTPSQKNPPTSRSNYIRRWRSYLLLISISYNLSECISSPPHMNQTHHPCWASHSNHSSSHPWRYRETCPTTKFIAWTKIRININDEEAVNRISGRFENISTNEQSVWSKDRLQSLPSSCFSQVSRTVHNIQPCLYFIQHPFIVDSSSGHEQIKVHQQQQFKRYTRFNSLSPPHQPSRRTLPYVPLPSSPGLALFIY